MRILWASNSPTSPSGYGVQTDLIVRRLAKDHDVAIASNYGHQEGMLNFQTEHGDVRIYPQSADQFSLTILPHHAKNFNADVILSHYDSWVYKPEHLANRWVPWFPMDTEHYPPPMAEKLRQALMPITQTRYSVAEAAVAGIEAEYIPAAFDGRYYYPRDAKAWKNLLGIPDRFVVGCVAANRGDPAGPSRKSYPQMFEAFAMFLKHEPNASLYVHAQFDGHIQLERLAEKYGILEHIIRADPYMLHTGLYTPDDMAVMYSGIDVLLQPSMGEGFGVPIAEAQACGTKVIVGDWTAMSEVGKCGAKISKADAFKYPIIGYGEMWFPAPGAICEALVESTKWKRQPNFVSKSVAEYEVNTVWEQNWLPTLGKLEQRIEERKEPTQRKVKRLEMSDVEAVA